MLDVSDNSTPFYEFRIKKRISMEAVENKKLNETGRGLALIAKSYPDHAYLNADEAQDGLNHFTIWYPERGNLEEVFEHAEIANKTMPSKAPSTQKKIFIVDDDKTVRLMLEHILSPNYHVYSYGRARDALQEFDIVKPDMVISDLLMPGMGGGELRKALSQKKGGDLTPFVFLSGNKDAATIDYINQLGIDDYLTKPIDKDQIMTVIERLLLRSSQVIDDIQGRVSSNITETLKPSLPKKIGNWRTAVRTMSLSTGGGDFLFHKPVKQEDKDLVVIADVMGHGLEAKFFSYAYAGYIRSVFYGSDVNYNPSELLEAFSKMINKDPVLESTIITSQAFCLENDGTFLCASAAHPKPLIFNQQEEAVIELNVTGPLAGLMGNTKYKSHEYSLSIGDRLIFFTDGFFETLRPGGLEDLKSFLESLMIKSIELKLDEAIEMIWQSYLSNIRPNQRKDDVTLVLIEYNGKDQ